MKKIGVISDTHIPRRRKNLPPVLWEALAGVDLILHAGDIVEEWVLRDLGTLAPVEAVAGNMDPGNLAEKLLRKKFLELDGKKIGLIHGDGFRGTTIQRAQEAFESDHPHCIVFGHSHRPFNETVEGILMFNPGSCTDPRREPRPSYGILYLEDSIRGEIHYFNP